MTDRGLQGWSDDPFRRHEARYFSAGRPTKLVRDGDHETYDEPSSDGCSDGCSVSDGRHLDAPSPLAAVAAVSVPTLSPVAVAAPGSAAPRWGPADSSTAQFPEYGAPHGPQYGAPHGPQYGPRYGPQYGPYPYNDAAGYPRRRSPIGLVASVICFLAVGATVAGLVTVAVAAKHQHRLPTPSTSATAKRPHLTPAAFVSQSAERTLTERTAVMTISGTVRALGHIEPVSGSGAVIIQSLGTRVVGGVTCTGYAVTPSVPLLARSASSSLRAIGVPADGSASSASGIAGPLTITIWVD